MENKLTKLNKNVCSLMMNRQSNLSLLNLSNKDKEKLSNNDDTVKINNLLKKGFSLSRIIQIKNYIEVIVYNNKLNIDINILKICKYQYKLVINFIEHKRFHFSIHCPIDIIKLDINNKIITQYGILAEVMIVDDHYQKYYSRLDFGISEDHTFGNTFYVYTFSEISKILTKLYHKICHYSLDKLEFQKQVDIFV